MVKVNGMGKTCPIPLIETKKAVKALTAPDTIEVMVDNTMAVKNITRFATDSGYSITTDKISDKEFKLTIDVKEIKSEEEKKMAETCDTCGATDNTGNIVVAVGSDIISTSTRLPVSTMRRCISSSSIQRPSISQKS